MAMYAPAERIEIMAIPAKGVLNEGFCFGR